MYTGEFANLRQNPLEEGRFILIVGASLAAIIGAVVSLRSAAAGFVLMGGSAGFLFFFPGINLATALPFVLLLLGVVFVAIDLGMSDDSKVQSPSD